MDMLTISSMLTIAIIVAYLLISRQKSTIGKSPSNFGIIAIASMILGIVLGYRTGSGWGYALIAHGARGLVIGAIKLIKSKS